MRFKSVIYYYLLTLQIFPFSGLDAVLKQARRVVVFGVGCFFIIMMGVFFLRIRVRLHAYTPQRMLGIMNRGCETRVYRWCAFVETYQS